MHIPLYAISRIIRSFCRRVRISRVVKNSPLHVVRLTVIDAKTAEDSADEGAGIKMHFDVVADITVWRIFALICEDGILATHGTRGSVTKKHALILWENVRIFK